MSSNRNRVRRIARKFWAAWCVKAAFMERRYDDAKAWRKWGDEDG